MTQAIIRKKDIADFEKLEESNALANGGTMPENLDVHELTTPNGTYNLPQTTHMYGRRIEVVCIYGPVTINNYADGYGILLPSGWVGSLVLQTRDSYTLYASAIWQGWLVL